MTVQEFFDGLTSGATWSAGVAFKRSNPLPIDRYSVFNAYTPEGSAPAADDGSLNYYIEKNPVAYPGQLVAVISEGNATVYVLQGVSGALEPVALASSEITADVAELEGKVTALETWKGQVTTWQGTVLVDGDVESTLSGNTAKIPNSKAVKDVTDALDTRLDAVEGAAGNYVLKADIDTASLSDSDAKVPSSKLVKTTTDALDTRIDSVETKITGLGTTYEALANKSQNITTDTGSNAKYPTVKAVEDYVDAQIEAIPDVNLTPYQTKANLSSSTSVDADVASETKYPSVAAAKKLADAAADAAEASVDTKLKEYIKTAAADSKYIAQTKVETAVSGTSGNIPDSKAVKTYVDGAVGNVDVEKTLDEVLGAGAEATNKSITLKDTASTSSTVVDVASISFVAPSKNFSIDVADSTVNGDATLATSFKTWLGLENVTNESKATMFRNPAFTGTATLGGVNVATVNDITTAVGAVGLDDVVSVNPVVEGDVATNKLTLGGGFVSLENATNNFQVNVVNGTVTGSEGMKEAFINWLGVGQVYRYETA